ncbi:MAG: penicillin acylase family protein [Lacunisphaera sp.]|nr:penicillin acylase family protein [Lacunisphaera sp.]
MSPLQKRLAYLLSVLSVLLLIVVAAVAWGWWQMRSSRPQLGGERVVAGLSAPVKVERDVLGVPTITGATRPDVARATGFVHAQDRFFQMDLLRRRGAGELSELFGRAAVELDTSARLHGFRRLAEKVVAQASPAERALLSAYTAGVNSGLTALPKIPWEYLVLRTAPAPWREEDTILCIYAMWFDLQDYRGTFELNRDALRRALGQAALDFLAPPGNSWDAALDGSTFAPAPLPPLRFKAADQTVGALAPQRPWAVESNVPYPHSEPASKRVIGSNAFALDGANTATGAAMLANDMHLDLNVPHIWYRAVLQWTDASGPHRVVGVTLPGVPFLVVGSNGRVAWGFTDAYVDTTDLIYAETDNIAQSHYRTPRGWVEIKERLEEIRVKGESAEPFTTRWTEWGPILSGPEDGRYLVLRWTAHEAEATNLQFMEMETTRTAAEGVTLAHRAGIPNENMLIADADGHIAWTIIGKIPRRVGYDGRLPVSWAYGDRRWDGWLKPEEIPVVTNPAEGLLWSGNNRPLDGGAYARLGDSGYDDGPRARQIRDDLLALNASGKKAVPGDLLAIELDDRALYLQRWQIYLLEILSDEAVAGKKSRGELRDTVRQWNGRASADSAAYRLVRAFRGHVAERTLAPFIEQAQAEYAAFNWRNLMYEDALWQLVHEQPAKLLNPAHASWSALLLAAADDLATDVEKSSGSLTRFTWGTRNTLAMQHPFGRFLPAVLARLLDMPAVPLPGDSDMPRVQNRSFGASERLVVSPGHEDQGIFHMPGGQSGHPLSPYYRAGHEAWVKGEPTPLLPGPVQHTLVLKPQ